MSELSRHHDRLTRLFVEASKLEGAERRAFVEAACEGDEAMRLELESLLAHDGEAGRQLEQSADRLRHMAELEAVTDSDGDEHLPIHSRNLLLPSLGSRESGFAG